ncbi:hypothetical protein GVAV_001203 [Gurleya vavrai]
MSNNTLEFLITPYTKSLKPYVLYEITVICDLKIFKKNYFIARKRYSEILKFHNSIKKNFDVMPEFPKKTFFKCDEHGIKIRTRMFQNYFKFLALHVADDRKWIDEMVKFLESE